MYYKKKLPIYIYRLIHLSGNTNFVEKYQLFMKFFLFLDADLTLLNQKFTTYILAEYFRSKNKKHKSQNSDE